MAYVTEVDTQMTIVFIWCDCGTPPFQRHYYTGRHCPFSGWTAPYVHEVLQAVKALERTGNPLTVDSLISAGLKSEAVERVMIAEFPEDAEVPYALGVGSFGELPSPKLYLPKRK